MLFLTLPQNEPAGTCRINGEPAEYRVGPDFLEFRNERQEAWERRGILDSSQIGDLIQFVCDDGPESEGPYTVIQSVAAPNADGLFYWIAINGASCSASEVPMPKSVHVSPIPEQLLGYRSREEQLVAQRFFLTAPIKDVDDFMKNEMPGKIASGEVVFINPSNPEPPTTSQTLWEC